MDALADELHGFMRLLLPTSTNAFEAVAELELPLSQVRALMILDHRGEMTIGALAARLGLSQPAASRSVEALQRAGLVTRREDPVDRRVKRVLLAERGRAIAAEIQAVKLDALRTFAAGLTEEERIRLHEAVAPIVADRADVV